MDHLAHLPRRVLMGPGPSPVPDSVLRALASATIGHLDPAFIRLMDDLSAMMRRLFQTQNALTIPMSGTGSAGMETVFVNLLEPGDRVLVAVNGVFGTRMAEVARRCGAEVRTVDFPWGEPVCPQRLREAASGEHFKVIALVHAETSTGVESALHELRGIADDSGALLVVDAVTSLGGVELKVDDWGLDAVYAGTQKCLSCPPGLAPVTLSERAERVIAARRTPVQSWYLDLSLVRAYWGQERAYHHTAPINMLYGLHEALRLALAEGLEARFARHRRVSLRLATGLEAMGLALRVSPEHRLAPLTTVCVPKGGDEAAVRARVLETHNLEIGGGLGAMKGEVWRIGLMGAGASDAHVDLCLDALKDAL